MKKPHNLLITTILITAFILNPTYTSGAYKGLYSQSAAENKGDIAIDYLKEGDSPQSFLFNSTLQGKKPLIIFRPTTHKKEAVGRLARELCTYNKPLTVEIDCSNYASFKDYFRSVKTIFSATCPKVSLAFGISETENLWKYYPGDEYVDYIALNYKEKSNEKALTYDPYDLFNIMYIFGKAKPIIINLSVYAYSSKGHKYYTYEACKEIDHIKSLADTKACIYALNYIEKTDSTGSSQLTLSSRLKNAFWN